MIFDFVFVLFQDSELKRRRNEGKQILVKDVVSRTMMPTPAWYAGSWALLLSCIFGLLGEIPISRGDGLPRRSFQAFTKIEGVPVKVYIPVKAERSFKEHDPEKTIYVSKLIIVEFQDVEYGITLGVESIKSGDKIFYRDIEYTSETYEPGVSGFPVYLSRRTAIKLL